MEERKSTRTTWIVILVVVAFLFMCGMSAVVGGVAGYVAGKNVSERYQMSPEPLMPSPRFPDQEVPEPWMPRDRPFRLGPTGALVAEIDEEGPAYEAGLRVGDVIQSVDGQALSEQDDLTTLIGAYEPGDVVEIVVYRQDDTRTYNVELGRHPTKGGETAYLGVTYRTIQGWPQMDVPEDD